MSSRLALDSRGRRISIVTTPSPGLHVGDRFLVLGDCITTATADDPGHVTFLGTPTGRLNGVREPRRTNRDPLLPVDVA